MTITLIGKSRQYAERKQEGVLPAGLADLKHSIPWPIDLENIDFHFCGYFNELNYSSRAGINSFLHKAVDIQTREETEVLSPERAEVIFFDGGDSRGLMNIYLFGLESKIVYILGHLDRSSIPRKIKEKTYFSGKTEIEVEKGEIIGTVGRWPVELPPEILIPEDVAKVFERKYNHLHFETHHYPCEHNFSNAYELFNLCTAGALTSTKRLFNPLLILKALSK